MFTYRHYIHDCIQVTFKDFIYYGLRNMMQLLGFKLKQLNPNLTAYFFRCLDIDASVFEQRQ